MPVDLPVRRRTTSRLPTLMRNAAALIALVIAAATLIAILPTPKGQDAATLTSAAAAP